MKRLLCISAILMISSSFSDYVFADIKDPTGWHGQYADASCFVRTGVLPRDDIPPWTISMGYVAGDQLIFFFTAYNSDLHDAEVPEGLPAWFMVDETAFEALGIHNNNGQLVLPIENSLRLQRALNTATGLGIAIHHADAPRPVMLAHFSLSNIRGAIEWLTTCNALGVRALPQR